MSFELPESWIAASSSLEASKLYTFVWTGGDARLSIPKSYGSLN